MMRPMARRSTSSPHVVVGTDFSTASQDAVARAILIAKDRDATLHMVHAEPRIPAVLSRRFGLEKRRPDVDLQTVVQEARAKRVNAKAHHREGGAVTALRSVARDVHAEVIVVGTRGRTVPDAFVGSTAERIATLSRTPVLLVRNSARSPYRKLIIAADRESKLEAAVRAARFVSPRSALSVLHAFQGPYETTLRLHGAGSSAISSHRAHARSEARAMLLQSMEASGLVPSSLVLRHGDPRRILHETPAHALLVMQRGSILAHVLLGSVTRTVIAHGQSDVLLL